MRWTRTPQSYRLAVLLRMEKAKRKGDPNGYMGAAMYNGSTPCIKSYRFGGRGEVGKSAINWQTNLNAQQSLGAAANRSANDATVRLPLSSLGESTQAMYLENWESWVNYCRAGQITHWLDTFTRNWGQEGFDFLDMGAHRREKRGGGAP